MTEQPEQVAEPNHSMLKWIVSVLGVLIVVFAVVIAVTIYKRMTATDTTEIATMVMVSDTETSARLVQFGDVRVPLPDDMDVISLNASGERLFIIFGTEGAARLILVVSLQDGAILGSLNLERDGILQK